jgi:hypothetical protein
MGPSPYSKASTPFTYEVTCRPFHAPSNNISLQQVHVRPVECEEPTLSKPKLQRYFNMMYTCSQSRTEHQRNQSSLHWDMTQCSVVQVTHTSDERNVQLSLVTCLFIVGSSATSIYFYRTTCITSQKTGPSLLTSNPPVYRYFGGSAHTEASTCTGWHKRRKRVYTECPRRRG